jgi:hypothetical protein
MQYAVAGLFKLTHAWEYNHCRESKRIIRRGSIPFDFNQSGITNLAGYTLYAGVD